MTTTRELTRQFNAIATELRALLRAQHPQLLAETGCGALTAAILIGRTAGAEGFKTDAGFARHFHHFPPHPNRPRRASDHHQVRRP